MGCRQCWSMRRISAMCGCWPRCYRRGDWGTWGGGFMWIPFIRWWMLMTLGYYMILPGYIMLYDPILQLVATGWVFRGWAEKICQTARNAPAPATSWPPPRPWPRRWGGCWSSARANHWSYCGSCSGCGRSCGRTPLRGCWWRGVQATKQGADSVQFVWVNPNGKWQSLKS